MFYDIFKNSQIIIGHQDPITARPTLTILIFVFY